MLVGICLGIQLLMTENYEFGRHKGLGVIEGDVVPFGTPRECGRVLKVPQVGWDALLARPSGGADWETSLLRDVTPGESMYFVHSYFVRPQFEQVVLSTSRYGDVRFCFSLAVGNVAASQCHPERSGARGLTVYKNIKHLLHTTQPVHKI